MEEDKKILLLEETVAQLNLRNRIITSVIRLMDVAISKDVFLEKIVKIMEETIHCDVRIMEKDMLTGQFCFYPKKNEDDLADEDMEKREFIIKIFNEVEANSSSVEQPGFMSFPIGRGKDISGVIAAFNLDESEKFPKHEVKIFNEVSLLLKKIMESLLLITDMDRSIVKMRSLFDAVKKLSRISDFQELLSEIGNITLEIVECEGTSVLLLGGDRDKLVFSAVSGEHAKKLKDFAFPKNEGIAGWAFTQQREAVINDVSESKYFSSKVDEFTGSATRNLLVVPLGLDNEPMGVMEAVNKTNGEDFSSQDLLYFSILASQVAHIIERARLYGELNETFMNTVVVLADAIEFGSPMTIEHSRHMQKNAMRIALKMGLTEDEAQEVSIAALLHDVGKIGIPDVILQKKGPLTDEEWKIIKKHPEMGAKILEPIRRLKKVVSFIRSHHERWDGGGYPSGMKGEEIPVGARIIAVCDAFDAMISERNYGRRFSLADALKEISANSGTQFAPQCVEAAVPILGETPPAENENPAE
ncbi:MAG: HD domain-containing phosphohydrolase [bacterium]